MPKDAEVLVIVADQGLRDAIGFALEAINIDVVHGENLDAIAAEAEPGRRRCVIVDDRVWIRDALPVAIASSAGDFPPVIMLAFETLNRRRRAPESGVWRVIDMPIADSSLFDAVTAALALPEGPGRRLPR